MNRHPFADAIAILEEHYYQDADLALWLTSPQPLLNDITPLQALAEGRKAEVLQSVQALDAGVYI